MVLPMQSVNESRRLRKLLPLTWLWPVPVGMLFGAQIFGPYLPELLDPEGHKRGAGLGGLLGLILALVLRIRANRPPARVTDRRSESGRAPASQEESSRSVHRLD